MKVVNLTSKWLDEFEPGDTLYVSKNAGGYQLIRLCRFEKIVRGVVYAVVLESGLDWDHASVGRTITARKASCALWGGNSPRFHWYHKVLGWK